MTQKLVLLTAILLISLGRANAHPQSSTADSLPLLNRPAPEFHLKDLEGKVVSLSHYRGKVIVLDFWATWCVPCQQSFPGVQKAIDHFKSDADVVFLFIDTRETAADFKQRVKAQMKKNQYSFHVVFDETGPTGLQNQQFLIYGMPGIPTKFIIDANGIIRYQLIGYDPKQSPEENAAELVNYVERVKAITKK